MHSDLAQELLADLRYELLHILSADRQNVNLPEVENDWSASGRHGHFPVMPEP